ncbi:MAG: tetratricopeptide repeat protein [Treponema sp.]
MSDHSVQTIIKPALDFLKRGELEQSYTLLRQILEQDLENKEVLYAIRGISFWRDRVRYAMMQPNDFLRGENVIAQWKDFLEYMYKNGEYYESILYVFKCGVFSIALQFYRDMIAVNPTVHTAELYRKTGLCYKALGDYETAINCLRYAADVNPDSSAIIAELADAYALSGEVRFSKVFFREAFFKNASEIEFCFLESDIMEALIKRVEAAGYKEKELSEWLPVFAVLDGVFSVKRELKALELGKLRQSIYTLENELRSKTAKNVNLLIPRLINHYFWLIDHYMNGNGEKTKIDEILLRIKLLDEEIYERYIR